MQTMTTSGVIRLKDDLGLVYDLSKIEYKIAEDDSFEYVFTPNYSVMDLLKPDIFQGIPGLNLDLRKDSYVRTNRTPVFISERTPGENREDLWDLLAECEMDYLNRLEWLIRTDKVYSGDRLYVDRYEDRESAIKLNNVSELGNRSVNINKKLLDIICSGKDLITPDFVINDSTRGLYYPVLLEMFRTEKKFLKHQQAEGIQYSKEAGKYKGRKRKDSDSIKSMEAIRAYYAGRITAMQAAETMEVSRSTFFRRAREYKDSVMCATKNDKFSSN